MRMRKGQETRAAIVDAALEQAARAGLEGLTIGPLADRMQMSKSGVFAHFGSREDLQIAVLKAYGERFIDTVLKPALRAPRGLPRLLALVERWLDRTIADAGCGCLWISSASEFDDRPGAVRDELVATLRGWQRELARAIESAVAEGQLAADVDVDDLVFALHAAVLALHHDARLMDNPQAALRARRAVRRALSPWVTARAAPLLAGLSPESTPSTLAQRGSRHAAVHPAAS